MSPFETVSFSGKSDDSELGTALGTAVESADSTLAGLVGLWPNLSVDQRKSVLELLESFGTTINSDRRR